MNAPDEYRAFLEAKKPVAAQAGFHVSADEVNPALKPFVRKIVPWALRGGRRAIFSRFGLHKTSTQLEMARLARIKASVVPLIILPLGVRHEFFADAESWFRGEFSVRLKFIRRTDEMDERDDVLGSGADVGAPPLIYLTNYESVREGKIDPGRFGFVSLDEAAVLRGFGGTKTFRNFMGQLAGDDRASGVKSEGIRYRFVATATPSPNDYIELLAYAAFLDVMDVGQAKTRFFKRDSEKADRLTIHPHKEREFWLWVASWALFVQRPSDLGFPDDGYELPPVEVRWHEIPSDHSKAGEERDGQGRMFRNAAVGVSSAAAEKRDSLPARIAKMQEIIASEPDAHRIIWHDLEAERKAIEAALPDARSIFGGQVLEANEEVAVAFKEGRLKYLGAKPQMSGAGNNFQKHCHHALFLGIGFKFHDFIQGVHRIVRFGQEQPCTIDLIYSEAEREVRRSLEQKWARHEETVDRMSEIIREHGLSEAAFGEELARSIGVERHSRARWQTDANGFWRSSGDRRLLPEELVGLPADVIYRLWRQHNLSAVYDFEHHVACAEALDKAGQLPPSFALLPPHSDHPHGWSDITRMRTLNLQQHAKGQEFHLCPLQFDLVDRVIARASMRGETVLDPFGGLMTVPERAIRLRRHAVGIELNPTYWRDGVEYCRAAEAETGMPSLFDAIEAEGQMQAKGAA